MSSLTPREIRPSGTTLRINAAQLERLHRHALEGYPFEVVGILAGDRAAHTVAVAHPLINERADSAASRYTVSGLVLMKAEQALAARGLEVVGYYHSHPDHPAMYSDTDRDLAMPNMSYLICAVAGLDHPPRVTDTRSWRLADDRTQMTLEDLRTVHHTPGI